MYGSAHKRAAGRINETADGRPRGKTFGDAEFGATVTFRSQVATTCAAVRRCVCGLPIQRHILRQSSFSPGILPNDILYSLGRPSDCRRGGCGLARPFRRRLVCSFPPGLAGDRWDSVCIGRTSPSKVPPRCIPGIEMSALCRVHRRQGYCLPSLSPGNSYLDVSRTAHAERGLPCRHCTICNDYRDGGGCRLWRVYSLEQPVSKYCRSLPAEHVCGRAAAEHG